jgi:hypothetical protein
MMSEDEDTKKDEQTQETTSSTDDLSKSWVPVPEHEIKCPICKGILVLVDKGLVCLGCRIFAVNWERSK